MSFLLNKKIVFLSAKRTPFGSFGGALREFSATDLGVIAGEKAIEQISINPKKINQIIFGNVLQTSSDAIYLSRHIGLRCNIPEDAHALTVNRLCGSGFQSIIAGAEQLILDEAECVMVGGTESMSQAPHIIRNARWGIKLGQGKLEDSLWSCLTDSYTGLSMALTAENLAEKYSISQSEVDEFSVRSQKLYKEAYDAGNFKDEIIEMKIEDKKNSTVLRIDEHPKSNTTISALKTLPKVFKKDGVIHAGAASGICDGSCALIMATEKFAKDNEITPIARLIGFGISGCDPRIMGIGPVPAIKVALKKTNLSMRDIDLIDVNEAFAPQVLAVKKELKIPDEKLNVNGGALAIGHPLGASGARITANLIYSVKNSNKKIALGSACIGGGQGISVVIEKF